ncbi:MAG: hypothetical protein EHM58_03705 [Ignavibacteriae bacterium]|nr:MAG: hypothetical protein EHM58_03705 [Ignavibacteriota bacterium]
MKPSNDLFDLIKSLTKSEKRYFKLFASMQKGSKNYVKLFDVIEKQKVYNESLIKEKFKNEKFIKQLTFTKNYLYKLVFKSLIHYSKEGQIDGKLNEIINRAKLLYNKALYKQYFNILEKGKETALKYERFNLYLQMIELEKVIIIKKIFPEKDSSLLYRQEIFIINKIKNLAKYNMMVERLTGIYRVKGRSRDIGLNRFLENLKDHPLIKSEEMAISARAKEQYYFIHQLIADFYGDFEKMHFFAEKRFEIIQQNIHPFEDHSFNFWHDVLMYLLLLSIRFDKMEMVDKYYKMLGKYSKDTVSEHVTLFLIRTYLNIVLIIKNKEWDKLDGEVENIEKGFLKYEGKIDRNFEILIYSVIIKAYIHSKCFESALKYTNKLLNHPLVSVRQDVEWYSKILNLIVHYELKNYMLLEYLIKSTYRYLYKRSQLYKLESLILNFIRKLPRIKNDEELAEHFIFLKKGMTEIKDDPFEKNAFFFFDFIGWTDEKIKELKKK